MAHTHNRRTVVGALVALALLTLAPRTSQDLDNGWRATILSDTFEGASAASTLSLIAIPPPVVPVRTDLTVTITGGTWKLAAASPECSRVSGAVVCVLEAGALRRQHVIRLTVRSAAPLSYALSTPVPG